MKTRLNINTKVITMTINRPGVAPLKKTVTISYINNYY